MVILGVSRGRLWKMADLPCYRYGSSGHRRYLRSDVKAFMERSLVR